MRHEIYKPNPFNNGSAANFNAVIKDDAEFAFYVNIIQQASWDEVKKIGSFAANAKNPDKTGNIMFNVNECGEILSALKNRHSKGFYHKTAKANKSASFSPYQKKAKDATGKEIEVPAFGFSLTIDGSKKFKIPLDPGEIEVLITLIQTALMKYFSKLESKVFVPKDAQAEDTISQ